MLTRLFSFLFLLPLLLSNSLFSSEALKVSTTAESVILINADTGAVLYEKQPKTLQDPASITKIATILYALQKKGDHLDEIITADQDSIASVTPEAKLRAKYKLPAHWVEVGSNHMGIKFEEKLTLEDLMHGAMLISANDACNIIAKHVSGSVPAFMTELNDYVKKLGCQNTRFINPHGLPHPDHRTTAYDMAIITREALKNPKFREIVAKVKYTRPKTNKQEKTVMVQSNRLLRSGKNHYAKAIGVKTGGSSMAQNTFVAAAQQDGRTLIAVLLRVQERNDMFEEAKNLFEAAFNQQKVVRTFIRSGPQSFILDLAEGNGIVKTCCQEDLSLEYYPAEDPKVKGYVVWDSLNLPIAKDQHVGEVRLVAATGDVVKSVPLYSQESMVISMRHRVKELLGSNSLLSLLFKVGGILAIITVFLIVGMRFRRG
jgi:D-alanyl-D-alanine carboxypeptidase (penicillin-binding protein 5/6)